LQLPGERRWGKSVFPFACGESLMRFSFIFQARRGFLLGLLQKAFSIAVAALYSPGPQYLLTKAMG
jgi:hypothetical protein